LIGLTAAFGLVSFFGGAYTGALLPVISFGLLVLGPVALLLTLLWGTVMGNPLLLGRSFVGLLVAAILTVPALVLVPEVFAGVASQSARLFGVLTVASGIGIGVFALFAGGPRTMLVTIPLVLALSGITFFATETMWLQLFERPANVQQIYDNARGKGHSAQTLAFVISMPFVLVFWIKALFSALLYVQFIFTLALPFLAMFLVPVKSTRPGISVASRPVPAFAGTALVLVPALAVLGFLGWAVRQHLPAPEETTQRSPPNVPSESKPPAVSVTNVAAAPPAKVNPWSAPGDSFHLEVAWTREMKHPNTMGPVIGRNRSLYLAAGRTLLALSEDGSEQWRFETDTNIKFWPGLLPDGSISIYSESRRLTVLTPAGAEKWSRKLPFVVARSPLPTPEGTVYVCVKTSTNRAIAKSPINQYSLIALHPDNSTNWLIQLTGVLVGPVPSPDRRVLYVGDTKTLRAIDEHGSERWQHNPESPFGDLRIGEDGTVFVVARTRLLAISPEGRKQWEFEPPVHIPITDLVLQSKTRILCRSGSTLYVVDSGGKVLWKRFSEATLITSYQSEKIYGAHDKWLYILSPDGAREWKVRAAADADIKQAVGQGDQIYILSSFGSNISALRVP
jgi:hypothetical protein